MPRALASERDGMSGAYFHERENIIDPTVRQIYFDVHRIEGRAMNQDKAVMALAALAQDTRLSVFRLLIKAGPDGMIAGALADAMAVPPSTMSHHLAKLEQAGLVLSWRTSRLIHYAADYAGVQALLTFLMADCCQGDPRACADLLSTIVCDRVGVGACS
jgi:ArsR family transcriptional regulator, arsenate/arsenite/antimonite-responsive transcriptional repressor